jgi:hypothetical protein
MNSRSLLIFLGLNKLENEFLIHAHCRARSGLGLQPTGHGGPPRVAGRQAGWASAWRPSPAEEVARDLVVASQRQGAVGELAGATGWPSGKAVGGGAHLNGGAAWRWWRSLRTTTFIGGEIAPVADGNEGVTLQCRCRRGKVRATSIGDNGGGWEGLTVKRRRRWCSDGNWRRGVSGGGSR